MKPLLWGDAGTIGIVEKELKKGHVILAEGDTVLGLLADVSQSGATLLNQIKVRSEKPYLILVRDYKKAISFIAVSQEKLLQTEKIMKKCWPGPVTLIFNAKLELPVFMKAVNGTIALRVPHHSGLMMLLDRFDALFSTSANRSGRPAPSAFEQVEEDIMHFVACTVLNDTQANGTCALPSTIIDCTGDQLVVIRQGAFSVDALRAIMDGKLLLE